MLRASKPAAPNWSACANEELHRAQQRAAAIKDFKLTIIAKAGTEGKLFGSVGTADIAEAATAAGHAWHAAKCGCRAVRCGPWASTWCSCTCMPTSKVELPVIIVAEEAG